MATSNTEKHLLKKIKHLENELQILEQEKEETNRKFYELYSKMEEEVRRRSSLIQEQNFKLKEEVHKRTIAEENLKKAVEEKDFLFRELHHRVKNNLQLISSIINLQIKDTDNSEAKNLLQESRQKIHSMALVHDFIYNAGTSDRINLSEYLKVLSKEIFRSAVKHYSLRKLNLDIAPDINASLKISLPCGLIVNELITNSLKHAFTKDNKGTIDVSLHMQQDNLNLIISDDGKGMGQSQFDQTGQCLGLNLVKLLVENQLKGTINFNGSNGTKFEIIIPNK